MTLNRRNLLRLAAGAGAGLAMPAVLSSRSVFAQDGAGPFIQPPLPYAEEALAPTISARTVGLHYGRHHAGYYRTLNRLVAGTTLEASTLEEVVIGTAGDTDRRAVFNNAGQAWNHVVYWEQFRPGGPAAPTSALAAAIEARFGGLEAMKEALTTTSTGVFGSGWGWLVADDDGTLDLMGTANGDNPMAHGRIALIGIDVWEHAYYLDYENRRAEHVRAVLDTLINWDVVAERLPG